LMVESGRLVDWWFGELAGCLDWWVGDSQVVEEILDYLSLIAVS
jgi:hypothetical protein